MANRSLVLNASFEPLCVVSWKRAVVLVIDEKADIVHAHGEIQTPSGPVDRPSVVRLRKYVKVPWRRPALNLKHLIERDQGKCGYCGGRGEDIDHIVPRSRGGKHTWENCVLACRKCNAKKGDRTLKELGWNLRIVPKTPERWLVIGLTDAESHWQPFLDGSAYAPT